MNRQLTALILCGGIVTLTPACATKKFVREQVGTTETRMTQRMETQETRLREAADRTSATSQALDATGQRVQGLDTRVEGLDTRVGGLDTRVAEVSALAAEARRDLAAVSDAQREAEDRTTQRFANRNKYAMVESRSIYFGFNKADLSDEGINDLEEVARALGEDPNAVVELQGFADPRGSDRYNYQLTRERVDAVVRHLVQRHGVDLRRIHAVGMGKIAPAAGQKANGDAFAKSRRVEIRLLAPQS
jgi:peptidoglycan-associated lipoprotein